VLEFAARALIPAVAEDSHVSAIHWLVLLLSLGTGLVRFFVGFLDLWFSAIEGDCMAVSASSRFILEPAFALSFEPFNANSIAGNVGVSPRALVSEVAFSFEHPTMAGAIW